MELQEAQRDTAPELMSHTISTRKPAAELNRLRTDIGMRALRSLTDVKYEQ